jgi:hypothetical protein
MKMMKYRIYRMKTKQTNPEAKDLRTPKYRPRVVHPKKYEKPSKITIRNYEDEG